MTMLALLPLQHGKVIWVAKNVLNFFENSSLRNFLVPPLLILNKKRIVLILAMYENTVPGQHCRRLSNIKPALVQPLVFDS